MQVIATRFPEVKVLVPRKFGDDRGYFFESWNRDTARDNAIDIDFVQDNQSFSASKGTVRGLHFQAPPRAQDKLVRCTRGTIFDVAVDVRIGSPTYGQWVAEELSADNLRQLLVPAGFLHGFMTLEDDCEVHYKCSDVYAPECDGAVKFDDKDLAIDWPLDPAQSIVSAKDADAQRFADFKSPFAYETLS